MIKTDVRGREFHKGLDIQCCTCWRKLERITRHVCGETIRSRLQNRKNPFFFSPSYFHVLIFFLNRHPSFVWGSPFEFEKWRHFAGAFHPYFCERSAGTVQQLHHGRREPLQWTEISFNRLHFRGHMMNKRLKNGSRRGIYWNKRRRKKGQLAKLWTEFEWMMCARGSVIYFCTRLVPPRRLVHFLPWPCLRARAPILLRW